MQGQGEGSQVRPTTLLSESLLSRDEVFRVRLTMYVAKRVAVIARCEYWCGYMRLF